ncbi:tryptophan--tRNA ligase [Ornithinimicrobium cryptoxanthini]|uniref:Tryptophan--tRNA ligase n=1 Tax=Ornithinimicrobium cryptoxanthini TaxID=2934161 RepID=A0ABY4YLD2_9MICO|nr:tryptophan--tRNA ligase [Ornithinimicrobium cryptoxanthini]USQ77536.1 tryptophan--tRNA ligase [Ornithinimicrobium cryptoxanthini]
MTSADRTIEDAATDDAAVGDALAASTSDASLARTIARSAQIETEIDQDPSKFRVLTGDRPTGNLHLGHYFGTLRSRVLLQQRGVETFILIADYQVITDRDGVGPIRERVYSVLADYLAAGLDPEQTTIFTHSSVPALNQLMLPFLSLVTDSELRRNPTVKAEFEATSGRPMSGLLLTYPVHQAADILFCKANIVPVGKDQVPHLEQARLIARRFEERYGRADAGQPVFPAPDALLSEVTNLLGTDGTKMSKSKGNTIELGMDADTTAKILKKAVTDADRNITFDPVNRPEVSNLVLLAAMSSGRDPQEIAAQIGDGGGGTLKKVVTEAVNEHFAPIRARRAELAADQGYLESVLARGNARANEIADATLDEVRTAMQMTY